MTLAQVRRFCEATAARSRREGVRSSAKRLLAALRAYCRARAVALGESAALPCGAISFGLSTYRARIRAAIPTHKHVRHAA